MAGEIVLVRHGETEWSRTGRHTGLTDVALTPDGERAARALGERLAGPFGLVLTSPLQRAARTAELAGLSAEVDRDLLEWDYGLEEGRTTAQAREERPGWSVWDDVGLGETLDQLAERQRRVLERIRPVLDRGDDVCLVGHGHAMRVLTACWLGLPPVAGKQFPLGAAAICRLGWEHGSPAVVTWNC